MNEKSENEDAPIVVKPEKTPEDLAAIACLDRLRTCEGEVAPEGLPLACIVKVVAYEDVPKANEKYAMATVRGPDGREWRLCINRYYLEEGMDALFVSKDAAMPDEPRYHNRDAASVKVRVYRFGFGVNARRVLPIVKRAIYHNNCGLLYPLDDFPELKGMHSGMMCAAKLHIDSVLDLQARLQAPRQKLQNTFTPKFRAKPKRKHTSKKLMSFLEKVKLHRDRFFR